MTYVCGSEGSETELTVVGLVDCCYNTQNTTPSVVTAFMSQCIV